MFTERREVISPLLFRPLIRQWLEDKRPLNELFTEILASDGTGEQWGAAASFIVNRNAEPNLVTRDIGRIFFGRDVQCAQCHDHPSVVDYEQSEYFGILSFVNRTYLFKDERRGGALFLGEKGEGLLEFASVFRPQDGKSTAQPVLPMGIAMDAEPDFVDSLDAYMVAPDKDKRAIPRYSRRQQLAVLATHRENESFNRNLANRRLALGEFVVEARGVQRRVRKQMQALWDQKTDCQQQIERITTLQKWLTQREKNREAIASGQSDEIAAQQKLLELQQVELIESWRRSFALRRVRGLSAEQITGAMYTALGLQYAIQAKAAAEWESLHQSNPAERDDVRKRQAFINAAVSNNMWDTVEDMAVERFALPAGSPQDGFSLVLIKHLRFKMPRHSKPG